MDSTTGSSRTSTIGDWDFGGPEPGNTSPLSGTCFKRNGFCLGVEDVRGVRVEVGTSIKTEFLSLSCSTEQKMDRLKGHNRTLSASSSSSSLSLSFGDTKKRTGFRRERESV